MKIEKIAELLNAEIICGNDKLDREIDAAFASDLMSDVLTVNSMNLLLLTGLVNIQTVRTSEIADIQSIVLVRNKKASEEMIRIAEDNGMVLLQCPFSMFRSSGILFAAGIRPVY